MKQSWQRNTHYRTKTMPSIQLQKHKHIRFRTILKNRSTMMSQDQCKSNCQEDHQSVKNVQSKTTIQFPIHNRTNLKDFAKSLKSNKVPSTNQLHLFQQPKLNKQQLMEVLKEPDNNSKIEPTLHIDQIKIDHKKIEPLKIEQIESCIDNLIERKLLSTKSKIFKADESKFKQICGSIDSQFNEIIHQLKNADINEGDELMLKTINNKIDILEKMLAENATQSEIMKKYFYRKATSKKVGLKNIFQQKRSTNLSQTMMQLFGQSSKKESVSTHSVSKKNYVVHGKQAFAKPVARPQYQANNQPLPRSSYGCDFLSYGTLPQFVYKQEGCGIMALGNTKMGTSRYKTDFISKQSQKINIRELDCCKDKYRNPDINFLKLNLSNNEHKMKKYSLEKTRSLTSKANQQTHYIKNMKTQNGDNYAGDRANIVSLIKHKNLQNLKHSFKNSMHI